MSVLDRVPRGTQSNDSDEHAFSECDFATEFPGLWEFIARQRYEGNPRATGRLLIYADNGKATLCLMDRWTGQVAFYASDNVSAALVGVERGLQAGTLDWRKDKKGSYRR